MLYWLAWRVTADAVSMPTSTVCQVVHNIIEDMLTVLQKIVHFHGPQEMEDVGAGFARLAGHNAFKKAAGEIDGCVTHLRPRRYLSWQQMIHRRCAL